MRPVNSVAACAACVLRFAGRFAVPGVLALVLVLPLAGCGDRPAANKTESADKTEAADKSETRPRVQIQAVRVEPVLLRDVLTLPGDTEPDADVVLSSETEGVVAWVGPAEGQRVAKGDVLVRIDVSAKRAKLEQAELSSRLAEEQAERRKRLFAEKVLSREELDESLTAMDVARATAAEARANFVQGEVRAPISGVVESKDVDPGEFVAVGKQLLELVNRDVVRVNVNVPEMDVRYLVPGGTVHVTVDAWPGREWTGRLEYVSAKADTGTRTFETRVLVDNADGAIRPGMLARASFLRREIPGAVTAPLSAIRDKGGERVLFVEQGGVARVRSVELGVVQGGLVQVLSGLAVGENLIVSGQDSVEDGVEVALQ